MKDLHAEISVSRILEPRAIDLLVAPRSESYEGTLRVDTYPYTVAKSNKRQY